MKRQLTTETRSAAAIRREINIFHILQRITFPKLWAEVICVLAVYVFPSVHGIDAIGNPLFGSNEDRRSLIGSASDREYSRANRFPRVDGH